MSTDASKPPLRHKPYVNYVLVGSLLVHIFTKQVLRPWALENEVPEFINIIHYSIPNFLEVMIGTPIVAGALFRIKQFKPRLFSAWSEPRMYVMGVIIAGIYVLTKEMKWHEMGGSNIYDPNDIIASLIGLMVILYLMFRYGLHRDSAALQAGI